MRSLSVAAAIGLVAMACSESNSDDGPSSDATTERRALLDSTVDQVMVPVFSQLETDARALVQAVAAFDSSGTAESLEGAKSAFAAFAATLQQAELLQVGVHGASDRFSGGLNTRDEMYSWPVVSACRVDQEIVREDYGQADFFENKLVNVYGLDALEYLLYRTGTENACPASQTINTDGSWAALDEAEIDGRRAAYAAAVAEQLVQDAARVAAAWKGDFANELRTAGDGSSVYSSSQAALDQIFASMFYFERSLKDTKLGAPLGVTASCMQTSGCPDLLESAHAQLSLEWAEANFEGFKRLYYAGVQGAADSFGFDDLLRSAGGGDLADEMDDAIGDLEAAFASASTPLVDHLAAAESKAVHTAASRIGTLLKTQFVSILALRVPNEGAADND